MIKSSTHDCLIVLGILNFFCFLLPYQINFNCFFFNLFGQICILIKVLLLVSSHGLLINFANNLNPDQAQQNVGPDLDPNCLTL